MTILQIMHFIDGSSLRRESDCRRGFHIDSQNEFDDRLFHKLDGPAYVEYDDCVNSFENYYYEYWLVEGYLVPLEKVSIAKEIVNIETRENLLIYLLNDNIVIRKFAEYKLKELESDK